MLDPLGESQVVAYLGKLAPAAALKNPGFDGSVR
jgi:hypothetical protein